MASPLNPVVTTVSIDGTNCYVQSLKLQQGFNCHHHFEILVDYEELDKLWFDNPEKMINMIGKTANITFKHKQTGEENLFEGIITETEITGQHGQQGGIIIRGCSPTILLDGCRNMDSFIDKTLKLIVDEVAGEQGNGASITCKPMYTSKIDFICQYDESAFELLNRLSYLYGEYFYYDGQQIYFGNPYKTASSDITYDVHLQDIHFYSTLIPSKQDQYHYLNHDDKEIDSPPLRVDSTPYAKLAMGRSEAVYSAKTTVPVKASILTKKGLDDMVTVEKTRQLGRMHYVKGNSQTCKVKIGEGIGVKLPKTMKVFTNVGDFIVTEVTHYVAHDGRYHNEFKGLPKGLENIPVDNVRIPTANPQIATVKDNEDDKQLGQVKVEFQWQKKKGKTTNWIRVQTPDAGLSDAVPLNRGYVFIPEKNDIVMIGFEYGDPNRPFVMGSIFSEKVSRGNGRGNYVKTITDKSRGQIMMNADENGEWGITIHDRNGNIINLDTKGKNINITAPETVTITAKNIIMNADQNIKSAAGIDIISSAGKNISSTAGENHLSNAGKNMNQTAADDYNLMATNITELAKESYVSDAQSIEHTAMKDMVIQSTEGKVVKNAKTRIDNNSGEKSTFH